MRHSASEDRRLRKDREKTYSDLVKANYVPRIDTTKRKEASTRLEEFITPKNIIKKLLHSN